MMLYVITSLILIQLNIIFLAFLLFFISRLYLWTEFTILFCRFLDFRWVLIYFFLYLSLLCTFLYLVWADLADRFLLSIFLPHFHRFLFDLRSLAFGKNLCFIRMVCLTLDEHIACLDRLYFTCLNILLTLGPFFILIWWIFVNVRHLFNFRNL